ncbi:MAG: ATP synthase F1 subunit delta [Leptospiraceae bacterium]|nr:ATP synthase F1 subunit delta [Leptospiraceae bacterium]MCP5498603.1 ATP synthase F1 subunit delta [Leptospiraceae bacterium]
MDKIHVAKVYALALLEIASESKKLAEYEEELKTLEEIIIKNQDIFAFFLSPKVSKKDKTDIAEKVLTSKVSDHILNFLLILIKNDRILYLEQIVKEFYYAHDKLLGRKRVFVHSAAELKQDVLKEIKTTLDTQLSSECIVETRVKPDLVGGFIVKYDDIVIDGSMKNHLEKIKKGLLLSKLQNGTIYEN